jgi:hypothetical protein
MLYPAPELPDDTPVENVRFATRIRKALHAAGMKTIADVREVSDAALLSLPDFGSGSLSYLREALGLPSTDGCVQRSKSPPDLRRLLSRSGRLARATLSPCAIAAVAGSGAHYESLSTGQTGSE